MNKISSTEQMQIFHSSRELLRERRVTGDQPKTWKRLEEELKKSGLDEMRIRGITAALHAHIAHSSEHKPIRLLHPVEKEVISTEAWGVLIEAIHLGMIENQAVDEMLEQIAQWGRLPIKKESIELSLANQWHNILSAGSASNLLPN